MINVNNTRGINPSQICSKTGNKIQKVSKIVIFENNILKTIWEELQGFIFTKDGYAIMTRDGYFVKCKDQ